MHRMGSSFEKGVSDGRRVKACKKMKERRVSRQCVERLRDIERCAYVRM